MTYERRPQNNSNKIILGIVLGCLGVGLLGAGVVGLLVYKSVRAMQQAMQQPAGPIDPKVVRQQFANIPLYPKAQLNLKESQEIAKVSRITQNIPFVPKGVMPKMVMAAWDVPDRPEVVAQWYEREMLSRGWVLQPQQTRGTPAGGPPTANRSFQQGTSHLMVMASGPSPQGQSHLMLMLMQVPLPGAARSGGSGNSP